MMRAHHCQRLFFLICLLLAMVCLVRSEVLPVKTYTTADGLLRDLANCIKRDSHGFLWFCTSDGLSRFDGYGFSNYTTDDGLPHKIVSDFLETRDGDYLVATNDGLARFNPKGKRGISNENQNDSMFAVFKPSDNKDAKEINVLFEDSHGVLWCGTSDGLYIVETKENQVIFYRIDLSKEKSDLPLTISAIIQDGRGNLWIGTVYEQGLNRILPDGNIEHYTTRRESPKNEDISTFLETKDGTIWAGMNGNGGLCSLVSEPTRQSSIFSRCYTKKEGLPGNWIFSSYQTSDGKLWIGTTDGAVSFDNASETGNQLHVYKEAQGLCNKGITAFQEDRDGNLWLSTQCGVKKIARSGFVRFNENDGLAEHFVNGIFTSHDGELFVITKRTGETSNKTNLEIHQINRFDKDKFTAIEPKLLPNISTGWGGGQIVVQDKAGNWWFPSNQKAVYRFPKQAVFSHLANAKPQAISIPDSEVFRIYEDSRGDVWISTMYDGHLLKWERTTETLHDFKNEITTGNIIRHGNCFVEDNSGTLWIGSEYADDLLRYKDGRFTILKINSQKPIGNISSLFVDHLDRLWLATSLNGVGRVDDTNAEELKIVWYNRKNGLATNGTRGLVEDNFGRMYVAHGRGVDRIEPNRGQIKHYTTADGLPQGLNFNVARDTQGALWFGGGQGLARLVPEQDKPRQTPNILLTGLRLNSEKQTVSELGEMSLPQINLDSNQTQVSIDFLGLGASLGEELKYQYILEGANSDWIETTQRTVDFANLAAGSYNFQVRAVTFDGLVSKSPATISFTIAAPVWKRWWFIALTILCIGGFAYSFYRYRVNRLLEVERVRTRIATDLHDDIGSNLTKISILSEVVKQKYETTENGDSVLSSIANISRESVASMSDIVWAINPKKDSLIDLTRRMRGYAEETLQQRDIQLDFSAPDTKHDLKLNADIRRHVYLIFKESLNNIVRHSQAKKVQIEFKVEGKELVLRVSDDGKGFDLQKEYDGNGLFSMKKRADEIGKFEMSSTIGKGTMTVLRVPFSSQSWLALHK